uniref:non-specific serine/threonine protein kinase n=1 Tax=Tetraselmis sp. GSL018 TaxID=582737 RepID=A0A061R280_9CHLO|mmetsp:Transcript_19336/g.46099  ORF Transcript_19336/g.46099 Transcript_19336/m.46099 type:complete len:1233 (+) Transcript_19336:271-3969(+)
MSGGAQAAEHGEGLQADGLSAAPAAESCTALKLQEEEGLDEGQFEVGKRLGRGSFATVYTARDKSTDKKVVIKKLDRIQLHQKEQVLNEVEMMKRAGWHPNLVSYKGHFYTAEGVLCIVMGYCEGGTLAELLRSMDPGVSLAEEQIMDWFIQLALAIHHLHEKNIIHRDLKPGNIFLNKSHTIVRIGDLGIAKHMSNSFEMATTMMGTPYYMSPELMANRPYSSKSDIWSLGCILYEMAARKTAFQAKGMPQLMIKIMRNAYQPLPSYLSRQFSSLVGSMLRSDPDARPAAIQLLQLPFVRQHVERALEQSISPQIDSILASVMESAVDTAAERRYERPLTAYQNKYVQRPRTVKSKHGSRAGKGKGNRPAKSGRLGRTQTGNLQTVRVNHATAKQWDSGAQYEQRQAQMREMRHQAREMEQRIGREVARQRRKATDPYEKAKEERKQRQLRAMMKERSRRRVAEEEAAVFREVAVEEAAVNGEPSGPAEFDRFGRCTPGIPSNAGPGHDPDHRRLPVGAGGAAPGRLPPMHGAPQQPGGSGQEATGRGRGIETERRGSDAAGMRISTILDSIGDDYDDGGGDGSGSQLGEDLRGADSDYYEGEGADAGGSSRESFSEEDDGGSDGGSHSEGGATDEGDGDGEDEDKEDEEMRESQVMMEHKLEEVWESNPLERMQILEKIWQETMSRKGGKQCKRQPSHEPDAELPSDPNRMLGQLGSFMAGEGEASSRQPDVASPGERHGALPPLKEAAGGGSKISGRRSTSEMRPVPPAVEVPSRPGTGPERLQPVEGPRPLSHRQLPHHAEPTSALPRRQQLARFSCGDAVTPISERTAVDMAGNRRRHRSEHSQPERPGSGTERALEPVAGAAAAAGPRDDPLLQAVALKRILTHRGDDGSSQSSTPSPKQHGAQPLLPSMHGQRTRQALPESPPLEPRLSRSQGRARPPPALLQPISPAAAASSEHSTANTPKRAPTTPKALPHTALEAGRSLAQAASALDHTKSPKDKRSKSMSFAFMRAMAVSSMKGLDDAGMLDEDEDPEQLSHIVTDRSMPQRMMELEQRQRMQSGHSLYVPPWKHEEPDRPASASSSEGKAKAREQEAAPPPASEDAAAHRRRNKPKRTVQIVEPVLSPRTPNGRHEEPEEDVDALMFTAVENEMREIRRWRDTLLSGRTSHELAALELKDRAATMSSGRSSNTSTRRTLETSAADDDEGSGHGAEGESEEDESDEEVINL